MKSQDNNTHITFTAQQNHREFFEYNPIFYNSKKAFTQELQSPKTKSKKNLLKMKKIRAVYAAEWIQFAVALVTILVVLSNLENNVNKNKIKATEWEAAQRRRRQNQDSWGGRRPNPNQDPGQPQKVIFDFFDLKYVQNLKEEEFGSMTNEEVVDIRKSLKAWIKPHIKQVLELVAEIKQVSYSTDTIKTTVLQYLEDAESYGKKFSYDPETFTVYHILQNTEMLETVKQYLTEEVFIFKEKDNRVREIKDYVYSEIVCASLVRMLFYGRMPEEDQYVELIPLLDPHSACKEHKSLLKGLKRRIHPDTFMTTVTGGEDHKMKAYATRLVQHANNWKAIDNAKT